MTRLVRFAHVLLAARAWKTAATNGAFSLRHVKRMAYRRMELHMLAPTCHIF
jgi:hypothetical protein